MKAKIIIVISILLFFNFASAQDPVENRLAMKEFVRSCTYGVLAGTLVGAATLAFVDKPGDNLNKVARGASLGLYAGIVLGIYVVYVVPNQLAADEEAEAFGEPAVTDEYYDDEGSDFRFDAFPIIGQKGIEGAAVQMQLLTF